MVGTIEQALEARDRRNSGDLSEFDQKMIGTFVRLEIPMTDIHKLRQVPALLREFADRIDPDASEGSACTNNAPGAEDGGQFNSIAHQGTFARSFQEAMGADN
jgi:hypothetical protein